VKRLAQIALGLFVLTQLGFLFASNLLWLLRRNETSATLEAIAWPTDCYADVTGQAQGWSQYSPNVAHQTVFPRLIWQGASDGAPDSPDSVVVLSDQEPANPEAYVRPIGNRLACYEATILLPLVSWNESAAAEPEKWRTYLRQEMHKRRAMIEAYFRWQHKRLNAERSARAGNSPVVLWARVWRVSPPGQSPVKWTRPEMIPVVRGQRITDSERFELQVYDPFTKRFIRMDSDGQP
jgi:hypothetical protein